jgi:tetratricopeptide (TPR) repeat protein
MPNNGFHLFLSYSRKDNKPANAEGEGWVTAFERDLKARHYLYSGRDLKVFFDKEAIDPCADWRRRLSVGLRQSRLFLAFLSPNYITSENCLWEWEQYLRSEHSSARGDDGLTPIFFIAPNELLPAQLRDLRAWLEGMQHTFPGFTFNPKDFSDVAEARTRRFLQDLGRRNQTTDMELQPWFAAGPEILRHLDAAERSEQVKAEGRDPGADPRTLAERLDTLDRYIAQRLDRIALSDLTPGNVARSHEHFVGRHAELTSLHSILQGGGPQSGGRGSGGRSMITTTYSLGGLGKTALARQYCHAYAEFYAAGGTWELSCEGHISLDAVIRRLADEPSFLRVCEEAGYPLRLTEAQRQDDALARAVVLETLRQVKDARAETLAMSLGRHPEHHSPVGFLPKLDLPKALLLLDNVDRPELLSAREVGNLPAEEWLELLVTTRLDPMKFGMGERWHTPLEVKPLPEHEALALIRDYQPGQQFQDDTQETSAAAIVRALGGYTLAVELAAAYLGDHAKEGYRPSDFLRRLEAEGLLGTMDALAGEPDVTAQLRTAQTQMTSVLDWSLQRLSVPARTALAFASLLMPDRIPMAWLENLTRDIHPEELTDRPWYPQRWPKILQELQGLRLLVPAGEVDQDDQARSGILGMVRIHRLVAEHTTAATQGMGEIRGALERFFDGWDEKISQGEDTTLRFQHLLFLEHLEYIVGAMKPGEASDSLLLAARTAADYESQNGSLERARQILISILAHLEKDSQIYPEPTWAALNASETLGRLGELCVQAGDLDQAMSYSQQSLKVAHELFHRMPDSIDIQGNLAHCYMRVGDMLVARGNLEKSRDFFERSVKIFDTIYQFLPESEKAAAGVGAIHLKMGDLFVRLGVLEQARDHFEICLETYHRLPDSDEVALEFAMVYCHLGDLHYQLGDPDRAVGFFERSLKIREDRYRSMPDSVEAARRLAETQCYMGLVWNKIGDLEQAQSHISRALEIREDVLNRLPDSADAARNLAESLGQMGDLWIVSFRQPCPI